MSDSLWPHEWQHVRLPSPSLSPGVCSNSCPFSQNTIQPSHPLSPPSLALSLSQHQGLFQWVGSLHQVAKVLGFQLNISPSSEYSGLVSFMTEWFGLLFVHEFSPALVWCCFGFMCWVTHVVFRHLSPGRSPGSLFGSAGAERSRGTEGDSYPQPCGGPALGRWAVVWRWFSYGLYSTILWGWHPPSRLPRFSGCACLWDLIMNLEHLSWDRNWITDETKITYSGKPPIPKLKTEELSGYEVLMNLPLSTYIFAQILQMPMY